MENKSFEFTRFVYYSNFFPVLLPSCKVLPRWPPLRCKFRARQRQPRTAGRSRPPVVRGLFANGPLVRILKAVETALAPFKIERALTDDDFLRSNGASIIYLTVGLDGDGSIRAAYTGQKTDIGGDEGLPRPACASAPQWSK